MRKISKKILAYSMWVVDLLLAAWLLIISRWALVAFVTPIIIDPTHFLFPKRAEVMDAVYLLLLGIGWVAFMIFSQKYYSVGARKGNLFKRFARITGLLFLCIFIVDSTFFYLQGFTTDSWVRWLIIFVELVLGIILILYGRKIPNHTGDEK
ncbi:MAG: hypothetical protein JXA13_10910 [Anaerolineales bacterium]|nr:hypothetical protein [Anaerolineales bacterium]